jgi:anti-anti-sigma factor
MDIQTRHYNNVAIISVIGRFNPNFLPQFFQIVSEQLAAGYNCLVIDLKQIDFLNSVGIKAIVRTAEQTRQQGGDLRIANARKNVYHTLKLAGIDKIIKVYPSVIGATSSYISGWNLENQAAYLLDFCGT